MIYISTTFSPSMLGTKVKTITKEISEAEFARLIRKGGFRSAVGHEITARILSEKFKVNIPFSRVNVILQKGDFLLSAIPQFRVDVAREFTPEEIKGVKFRYFITKAT